jgi:hypothetical protein
VHWVTMLVRLFTSLLFFTSATAQASYFVDTPPISIDLRMEGCFADRKCAAQAARLIPRFARSRGMPQADVRKALGNCLSPELNMAFCVSFEVFAVKDELHEIVQARLRKNPADKAALPLRDMQNWSRTVRKECFRNVKKEEPDARGRYLSEVLVGCESSIVIASVKKLR